MKPISKRTKVFLSLIVTIAVGLQNALVYGEDVFVTSYKGTTGGTDVVPCPPNGGFCSSGTSLFGASSSSASTCTPVPVIPASSRRVVYGNATTAFWEVTPSDHNYTSASTPTINSTFTALQNIGVYKIYITKGSGATTHSTNLVMAMSCPTPTDGDLADTNGVGGTSILVPFHRALPNNVWIFVGYITNHVNSPTVRFDYSSGSVDGTANRWNMDAVRFEYLDTCTGVANQTDITGPLAANQTFVNVTGVAAGATNVTVYANNVQIGQTNLGGGFAGGTVTVPTSALINNDKITSQQIKNGCASQIPAVGPTVGIGSNPSLVAFIGCWKNPAYAGPVGTNSNPPGSGFPYILKAGGFRGGFATAPTLGEQLTPDGCWKTVSFEHGIDPAADLNSGSQVADTNNPFCALESLVFAIDNTTPDSGPYDIYVDRIMNGDTVVEDFESYPVDSTNTIVAPNVAASPTPASAYLSAPNSSTISTNNAFDGTKSCRIRWQFVNESNLRWAHVLASGASGGKRYPQLDTTKPITIRYLVLPVGETTNKLHFTSLPVSQSKGTGQSVTFSVGAVGQGPFTYQWQFAGSDIPGEVSSSLTKTNLQDADAGIYSVVVTGLAGAGCSSTNSATLTIAPFISYTRSGNTLTLSWADPAAILQEATVLTGAPTDWTDVSGATSPYPVNTATGAARFFRLKK